jgi:hypothetical protein
MTEAMKGYLGFLLLGVIGAFALSSCETRTRHDSGFDERDALSRFHTIVGPLPEVESSTVQTSQMGAVVCEFTATQDVIVKWLYAWGNSRDHFKNVGYSDFHAKILELVAVKKDVVPYETTSELFDGVETRLYSIRIVVSEVKGSEWRTRIEVLRL